VTRDGGASWSNLTGKIPGAPKWAYVSRLEPSKFEEATVYATFDAHRTGDYGSYLLRQHDYGATWKSIAGNLPKGEVARSITEDTRYADVLYLGTETGLWVTLDRGKAWTRIRANLPTVPVYEITLHLRDNAMLLATHGRALGPDDLAPFQRRSAQAAETRSPARSGLTARPERAQVLHQPGRHAVHRRESALRRTGSGIRSRKADSVRIVIGDAAGNLMRELKETP
jgi:photosystem II stability/assembly factor-like uncharacterized protein